MKALFKKPPVSRLPVSGQETVAPLNRTDQTARSKIDGYRYGYTTKKHQNSSRLEIGSVKASLAPVSKPVLELPTDPLTREICKKMMRGINTAILMNTNVDIKIPNVFSGVFSVTNDFSNDTIKIDSPSNIRWHSTISPERPQLKETADLQLNRIIEAFIYTQQHLFNQEVPKAELHLIPSSKHHGYTVLSQDILLVINLPIKRSTICL